MPELLLLLNLLSAAYLTGLIWVIQTIHYPQFCLVGEAGWREYHRRHTRAIGWAVGPMMLVELLTAVALVVWPAPGLPRWLAWAGLAMVGLIWLSTAVLQVPLHHKLAGAFDPAACRSLVRGNWLRTILWSLRSVLLAYAVYKALQG